MGYIFQTSHGAPQAGIDEEYFSSWNELMEYLDDNPEEANDLMMGYAIIKEIK